MSRVTIVPIEEHPSYKTNLRLWCYSPVKGQWVNLLNEGWVTIPFDVESSLFTQQLRWLNVGSFFFPADVNPNESPNTPPIILYDDFLALHGVTQEFAKDGKIDIDKSMIRKFDGQAKIEALQNKIESLKEAASVSPNDLAINALKKGWQPKQNFTMRMLSKLRVLGYTIEESADKTTVRIVP